MAKRQVPTVLNSSEQLALLRQANPRYPTGQRNKTLIQVMLNPVYGCPRRSTSAGAILT